MRENSISLSGRSKSVRRLFVCASIFSYSYGSSAQPGQLVGRSLAKADASTTTVSCFDFEFSTLSSNLLSSHTSDYRRSDDLVVSLAARIDGLYVCRSKKEANKRQQKENIKIQFCENDAE